MNLQTLSRQLRAAGFQVASEHGQLTVCNGKGQRLGYARYWRGADVFAVSLEGSVGYATDTKTALKWFRLITAEGTC